MDEYRGSFPVQLILKLGDSGALMVPFKGGYVQFASGVVMFLSNLSPEVALFKYDGATNDAIRRRVTILEFQ